MIEIAVELRACDCCGADDLTEVWSHQHVAKTRNREFLFKNRQVVCRFCGFAFVSPCPRQKALDLYYRDSFTKFERSDGPPVVDKRLHTLKKYSGKGHRFLEVGSNCFPGFCAACERHFGLVQLVELNEECQSDFKSLEDVPAASIDLLAHYYVLEHHPHPGAFL